MRKFLSSTAGATFNQETPNFTVNVRMDCVELICKVDRGMYVILNMVHNQHGGITLVANWGRYFDRLQNYPSSESKAKSHLSFAESREIVNEVNPQIQIPKIDKNCPFLSAVMHNEDKDKVYEIEN